MATSKVTLTITEKQKEEGRDKARELGVNPTKFMAGCLVVAIEGLTQETFERVLKSIQVIEKENHASLSRDFFGTNNETITEKQITKIKTK